MIFGKFGGLVHDSIRRELAGWLCLTVFYEPAARGHKVGRKLVGQTWDLLFT